MATNSSIHARTPANLEVNIRNWGSHVSVDVTLDVDTVTFWPREREGQSVDEVIDEILEMMANIKAKRVD